MYFSRQSCTRFQCVSLYVAYFLFLGIFSFFGLKLAIKWIGTNPYLIFMACIIGIDLVLIVIIRLFHSHIPSEPFRWSVFLLTTVSTLIFVVITPLPITSVMISVDHVPVSMEFFLQHHNNDTRDKWRSVYKTRGDSRSVVSFLLPLPIQGHDEDLQVYMGYNPHRLYFGRYPPQVEIYQVAFGTDVLGLSLPTTTYKDRDLSAEAGIVSGPEISAVFEHRIRAPKMGIIWDEDRVRKNGKIIYITMIKLLWTVLYSGVSAAIIWIVFWVPKVKPIGKAIEKFLLHCPE